MRVVVGTRGSKLALWQTRWVVQQLRVRWPSLTVEEQVIVTRGDEVRDRPLHQVGGQGVFVKQIEEALLAGEIDLAVHSLKDLPTESPPGLVIAAVPPREDPRDALVSRDGGALSDLSVGAVVGTSSRRRAAQLRHLRSDLCIRDLRGNLDTRLARLAAGQYDAVVMAAAGLARLGAAAGQQRCFSVDEMVPAPGQGALAVQTRTDAAELRSRLVGLDDAVARLAVETERAFLHTVGGGCALPVGAHACLENDTLRLWGVLGMADGQVLLRGQWQGPATTALALAYGAGRELLERFRAVTGRDFGVCLEEG
ncbi:MAG: hydroxymethylbilane synthase [Chloroflexi bacterium]|nr:hydroxymethylbilane synthase [Chloroflexota bacterium]